MLEQQVVPTYYARTDAGLPEEWLRLMKGSIAQLGLRFNAHRMVSEYAERFYIPAHRAGRATN